MLSQIMRGLTSGNRRGVAVILGGTALGQLIIAASSPLLSRVFSPAAFGLLATFTAIASVGSIAVSARLEMAVPIVDSDEEARRIVRAGLGLCLILAVVLTPAMLPLSGLAASWTNVPSLDRWLWLVPSCCSFAAAFVVLNQWAVRIADFGSIGRRNTLRAIFTAGTQTIAGAVGFRPGGTVVGLTFGHAVGAAWMMRGSFSPRDVLRGVKEVAPVLRQWRWFCAKLTVSGLFNVAGTQIPVLLFAAAYTPGQVGWLALTQRTLALPVGLVGTAIMQVYVSTLAASVREERELASIFRRVSVGLSMLAVVGTAIIVLIGPLLFAVVFGARWEGAGEYARYLAIGIGAQLVSVPLSQTMIVVGRTTLQVLWDLGRFLVVCAAVTVSIQRGAQASTTVLVLGIAMFVTYAAQWAMSYYVVTHPRLSRVAAET